MSEIVKTEAVVLKAMEYRETSKIVTYFTKEHGKLGAIIKGARSPKNMYGTALEPMSYVDLVLYEKKGRELQTVTQCEVIRPYRNLFEDINKMVIGMAIIELVHNISHEQEKNPPLFKLLVNTLSELNDATHNPENLFYTFEVHLADILGFHLTFDRCYSCNKMLVYGKCGVERMDFQLEKGAAICPRCNPTRGHKVSVSVKGMSILNSLSHQYSLEKVTKIIIDKKTGIEIESLLFTFLRFHVSGVRALKSRKVFRNIIGVNESI